MSWTWTTDAKDRLTAFLNQHGLMQGPAVLTPIGDGHSNLTYRLDGGAEPMVLRRPPPPPLMPGSNDVLREARLITALYPTDVAVPRVMAVGEAGAVFDVPFYIMSLVDGWVITEDMPAPFAESAMASALGNELVDAMVRLHAVDWRAAGLADFGRPEGFNARHLKRMAGLAASLGTKADRGFDEIHSWLAAHVPQESAATIIHNDMRIGNVIWGPTRPPRLAAILDWELATIGDPLLDLAYLLASLPQAGSCRTPVQDFARACLAKGFPAPDQLHERYQAATGRTGAIDWYLVMANWKLAIFYSLSRRRGLDPYYDDETHVPRFLEEAGRSARRPTASRSPDNIVT